ncbi:MAG: hypothetical protein ACI4AX_01880 [Muribaculaceae bacterium]
MIAAALVSCGENNKEKAQALLDEASSLVERGDYGAAIEVIDTLDTRYAKEIDVRKQGLLCRARAVEGLAKDSIIAADDMLTHSIEQMEAREKDFEHIELPNGLDGYFIAKSIYEKNAMNKTGIQPRVEDSEGYFQLAVNIHGRKIGFERVSVNNGGNVVTTVAVNPGRLVTVEGSELVVLTQEEATPLVEALKANPGIDEYKLCGAKNSITVKLMSKMRDAIINSYDYAMSIQANRLAQIKREKFERQLQMARDQIANNLPSEALSSEPRED